MSGHDAPLAFHLRGTLLPESEVCDLWVADGVVRHEPVAGAETLDLGEAWVMPGLVDAHCHIGMARNDIGESNPLPRANVEAKAIADRDAGVLLIREPGSPSDVQWVREREDLPRFLGMGRHIARPKRYIRDVADEVEPDGLVDAVERNVAAGNGWIKLVGDWIDRERGDLGALWDEDQARAAIDRAHELGARVTAHTFGEEAAALLVAAGIDCLEHGTGITPDVVAQMVEQGTALVPTLVNVANFPSFAEQGERKFPQYAAHMRDLHARHRETFRMAHEAGVAIYAGTDAGGFVDHGRLADEVVELASVIGADDALGAASWRARPWLGADNLDDGASADLVVYAGDPRRHPSVLREPALIVLRGRVVAGSAAR